jgi:hypothetical protein
MIWIQESLIGDRVLSEMSDHDTALTLLDQIIYVIFLLCSEQSDF